MGTHTNTINGVVLMYRDGDRVNFNVNKNTTLNVGDEVAAQTIGRTQKYFKILEIKNKRQSSLSDYIYVETIAELVTIKK